jgi:hypothetical protein
LISQLLLLLPLLLVLLLLLLLLHTEPHNAQKNLELAELALRAAS